MAEIWPRLRKKLVADVGEGKRKKSNIKKSSTKSRTSSKNPYASRGLEKFVTLLEELQFKQQTASTLVERTASSLSAAHSISRSEQEWTASTLVRNASRRSDTRADNITKISHCRAARGAVVVSTPSTGSPDSEKLSVEERVHEPQGSCQSSQSEDVSATSAPGTHRCRALKLSTPGSFVHCQGSAFIVLVALGAFMSSRVGEMGTSKPLAAIVTFSAGIRIWRNLGMISARFMCSSIAHYFLTPLRSYLVTHIPRRWDPIPEESRNAESEAPQWDSSLGLQSAGEAPVLPLLLPIPENSAAASTPESQIPTLFVTTKSAAVSPSRRLAKKFSSRLKKLGNLFKSSNLNISESSSSSSSSRPSSPPSLASPSNQRRVTCPFSRRLHRTGNNIAEAQPCKARKIMQRQKSAEIRSCSKKARLCRMLSSETLEQYNNRLAGCNNNSANNSPAHSISSTSTSSPTSVDPRVVGLLVTLLFLLVGRVPAIMATSLFFVVVSPHSRARRRENRAGEAARKLHRNSPPRG